MLPIGWAARCDVALRRSGGYEAAWQLADAYVRHTGQAADRVARHGRGATTKRDFPLSAMALVPGPQRLGAARRRRVLWPETHGLPQLDIVTKLTHSLTRDCPHVPVAGFVTSYAPAEAGGMRWHMDGIYGEKTGWSVCSVVVMLCGARDKKPAASFSQPRWRSRQPMASYALDLP